jgi:hypothetical protein
LRYLRSIGLRSRPWTASSTRRHDVERRSSLSFSRRPSVIPSRRHGAPHLLHRWNCIRQPTNIHSLKARCMPQQQTVHVEVDPAGVDSGVLCSSSACTWLSSSTCSCGRSQRTMGSTQKRTTDLLGLLLEPAHVVVKLVGLLGRVAVHKRGHPAGRDDGEDRPPHCEPAPVSVQHSHQPATGGTHKLSGR